MRKGKGLKIATLAGSISVLFSGASFAAAPTGFVLNNFSVRNGDITTSPCNNHVTGLAGYSVSCSSPVAVGKGFLQEIITISGPNNNVKQYIHTIVVDQNATSGTTGSAALPFQDESLVAYTTDQAAQQAGNQPSGIYDMQRISEAANAANQQTEFQSKTELSIGWANNAAGTDAVSIQQKVLQANTMGGTTTIGNKFQSTFDYKADVTTLTDPGNVKVEGVRTGYRTSIAQLAGLNNGPNGTEGDVQSFRLVQVAGTKNAATTATAPVSLPNSGNLSLAVGGAPTNSTSAVGTNQAMWLGQIISVPANTAGGTGGTTNAAGQMAFGYQSFDNLSDSSQPIYYYSLTDAGPFQNRATNPQDAWNAAGIFGTAPSLADPGFPTITTTP